MLKAVTIENNENGYFARYSASRCTKCILSENFPGIEIDDAGICSVCKVESGKSERPDVLDKSLSEVRELIQSSPDRTYDCLVLYSGGKDSSYSLYVIKKILKLKPLALTIDNGFISQAVLPNMKAVLDSLEIDHIIFKPAQSYMRSLYKQALQTKEKDAKDIMYATSACGSCISTVLSIGAKEAISRKIPVLMGGWSPGQLTEKSLLPGEFLEMICQQHFSKILLAAPDLKDRIARFSSGATKYPSLYNPLYAIRYNEEDIIKSLQSLGWVRPKDTDSCSSNCRLNGFLVVDHIKKYGFHPYEYELAFHVRNGMMERNDALNKISHLSFSAKTMNEVKVELGV